MFITKSLPYCLVCTAPSSGELPIICSKPFHFISDYSNSPNMNWSLASSGAMHPNRTNLNNNIFHRLYTKCHNNITMLQGNSLK